MFESLILNKGLYPEKFIAKMGETSPHWSKSSWKQRETFLRHQMVCVLLCNTEELLTEETLSIKKEMRKANKEGSLETATTSSSSKVSVSTEVENTIYRCQLLEGKSNLNILQNTITKRRMGIDKAFTKMYDIYDMAENKLVEVKVTLNGQKELETFNESADPDQFISLFHINPANPSRILTVNITNPLPGVNKAVAFLETRLKDLKEMGFMDYEIDPNVDPIAEILCDPVIEDWVKIWKDSFWSKKNNDDFDGVLDATNADGLKPFLESKLKKAIEDTSLRKEPYMEYNGVLLPPIMKSLSISNVEKDQEMMTEMISDLGLLTELRKEDSEIISAVNEAINLYKSNVIECGLNHFQFATRRDINATRNLKWAIGLGVKDSVESYDDDLLRQPEYSEPPKRRYHPWMSNMLVDLAKPHDKEDRFYEGILKSEYIWEDNHPIVDAADSILESFLSPFCESYISIFCSEIRNMFSRLSGAYTSVKPSKKYCQIVIFPLYASGSCDGVYTRYISGFAIRGEYHAKQPTDRIPLITVECCDEHGEGSKYLRFVKKARWARTISGKLLCIRQNSIMKNDPTFLAYVHNSLYLSINMMGDLLLKETSTNEDLKIKGITFVMKHREWMMERATEGVMMALLGGSQEEGALAIIRKIFMNKIVWMRKRPVFGWDEEGLAGALNECLFDHPFALYMAQHMRESLSDTDTMPSN